MTTRTNLFVRNKVTDEPGVIYAHSTVYARVHWLISDTETVANIADLHVVSVSMPRPVVFEHGITQTGVEFLEDEFAKYTVDGWKIPDWIHLLRTPLNRTLYG